MGAFCFRQADRVVVAGRRRAPRRTPGPRDATSSSSARLRLRRSRRGALAGPALTTWSPPRSSSLRPAERMARRLAGRSLGLVLSGGGARAFAHSGSRGTRGGRSRRRQGRRHEHGSLRAGDGRLGWTTEEWSDVCGTSHEAVRRSATTRAPPSLIRARRAEAMLRRLFGDMPWKSSRGRCSPRAPTPQRSDGRATRTGPLVEAVGSSMAIPGLVPPVSHGAQLLIDGGVLNNLPIDLMAARRARAGPRRSTSCAESASRSGRRARALRCRPFSRRSPGRRCLVASSARGEPRSGADRDHAGCTGIALRDFRQLDRAVEAGRRAAEEALAAGVKESSSPRSLRQALRRQSLPRWLGDLW